MKDTTVQGILFICFSLLTIMYLTYAPVNPLFDMVVFTCATCVLSFGTIDICKSYYFRCKLLDLKNNSRGIGWQLAVFFATLAGAIVTWFFLSEVFNGVWSAVTGMYTFTGSLATGANLVRQIISFLVGFTVFFSIIWLWVNSHRSDTY